MKKMKKTSNPSSYLCALDDDDDDFQNPICSQASFRNPISQKPLKPSNSLSLGSRNRSRKPKDRQDSIFNGPCKEKVVPLESQSQMVDDLSCQVNLGLDCVDPTISCSRVDGFSGPNKVGREESLEEMVMKTKGGVFKYNSNSIESRLLRSVGNCAPSVCGNDGESEEIGVEDECELDVLLNLCSDGDDSGNGRSVDDFSDGLIRCPLCNVDISGLSDELRQVHTNECLDKGNSLSEPVFQNEEPGIQCPGQVLNSSPIRSPRKHVDVSPVSEWLCSLGLSKYEDIFVREEIDWDSLQWLTEEDLFSIGVTALGPRKKIIHALSGLRKENNKEVDTYPAANSKTVADDSSKIAANKLITDFFPGFVAQKRNRNSTPSGKNKVEKSRPSSRNGRSAVKDNARKGKLRDIPVWCCIPETPFRVDAFKYLRRDCSHWFLTHFHLDHYQGLTKSFSHGKIYCSSVTAKLVNVKIGISWDNIQILPLNQKISIAGIDVTCFDANHCPGSIIILFEPPNGKAVLHTGDFRFDEEMTRIPALQDCHVDRLILDTTYCDPQYDFPKQEAVIQFVIEAIQAEVFNPKTLFLIGSYTIGKERLYLEVARVLRKKVYINAAKLHVLECLGIPNEDMQWFTTNEQESHIHIVPMWTLASFKRLKHISNQYKARYSLIVAFSPTGWTFGKGKKKSPGRRSQQGTIVRYEVPYSEHSSFTELQEFVKFISPANIVPSVNNHGPESSDNMISLLTS
ncbi:Sterile alpha motif domain-containing protein [Heracleum sosnowskyi]|uniref:Sterile alpha motif domain-containing protein n=1 Tax=Heracleum sosnowskyi TaxID=360622 RepID=A0AAD8IYR8_9APIA|nr:Sterile alpha motif domain-containing protein [Heracleum sosnowskyi]